MHGYLILVDDPCFGPYKGIDRVPSYPGEYPDEEVAVEEYVFGDFKSRESNLIDTLDRAKTLLAMFANSNRKFEIVYCSTNRKNIRELAKCEVPSLITYGYDVALMTADYWSIVNDFPKSAWAHSYRLRLNANGLFDDSAVARLYLDEYRSNDEADADSPFEIILVQKVLL